MQEQQTQQAQQQECGYCAGKGFNWDVYVWSDGPGQVQRVCELCNGTGTMEAGRALLQRLVRAEQERAEAQGKLAHLRTCLALYRKIKRGLLPSPPPDPNKPGYILKDSPEAKRGSGLVLAPHPSPHASTWREYIEREANLAPTYEGDWEDYLRAQAEARKARQQ